MYSAVVQTGELLRYIAQSVVSRISHRDVLKMVCLVICPLATAFGNRETWLCNINLQ